MTGSTSGPRLPGTALLKIARLVFSEDLITTVLQPTISDLQREMTVARPHSLARLRALWRGYGAFWKVMFLLPFALRSLQAETAGAVSFPDVIGRVAVASSLVMVALVVDPVAGAWVGVVVAFAILVHAWYVRHPSNIVIPTKRRRQTPQINFSSTEVEGNVGGLIFVVGSVFVVALGLPSVIWFLFASVAAGSLLAWVLVVWHTNHPHRGLPENRIILH